MTGFTERADHERGFAEVYRREIVPILERQEAGRLVAKGRAMKWIGLSLGLGIAAAAGVIALGASMGAAGAAVALGLQPLIFGGIAALIVRTVHQKRWKSGLSAEAMPVACRFLGDIDYGRQKIDPAEFTRLGVTPRCSGTHLEDPVSGTHAGLGYAMTEARLTQRRSSGKGGSRTVTVFRGLLMRIELATPAPDIFFRREHGAVGKWLIRTFSGFPPGSEKIELDDPDFEAAYETYARDPAAARAFISPRLTDGLMAVARTQTGKDFVSAALSGRHMYLALPRKGDFLSLGSLFRRLDVPEEEFHRLLDELTLPRRVIDAFRAA